MPRNDDPQPVGEQMSNKRFMVDIESIGAQPGGIILSIGWVRFSQDGVDESTGQEVVISPESSLEAGLRFDDDTISWWLDQSVSPWRSSVGMVPLRDGLGRFLDSVSGCSELWAKPPSYDIAAIRHACMVVGTEPSWHWRAELCFRTLKSIKPGHVELPKMEGKKHGALDDAIQQAKEAVAILQGVNK